MKRVAARRTHISLPADLVAKIDALVGPRGRSEFLSEIAGREVRRRRLTAALEDPEPIMKDKDYPELAAIGSAEWVRRLRGHPPNEPLQGRRRPAKRK